MTVLAKPTILIVDDNPDVAHALSVLFTINGLACESALSPAQGLKKFDSGHFDMVIQDMNFSADMTSGEEGIALFTEFRKREPDIPIILVTAWTHLSTAVELVKAGAADYISKPWDDDKLIVTVRNLLDLGGLKKHQRRHNTSRQTKFRQLEAKYDLCGLLFNSDAMYDLIHMTTQIAPADVSVMITGPNGAGKEKIAEILQANSLVKSGPFVKVNVGALPKELIEAELFGAEAGAYTGATKKRIGRFEMADTGTLFLDEIGNLSLDGQAKLLRVLETGEFERIGSTETRTVDVRIISATNANVKSMIEEGKFREDLYYRLNVIELALPALKDRREDILPIAERFLDENKALTEEAISALLEHSWPGNIRELKNVMQRANLLSPDGEVKASVLGLPASSKSAENTAPVARFDEPSKEEIEQAIQQAKGVISDAARALNISRSALYRRMKKLAVNVE